MLPFHIQLRSGEAIYEQVVFAVKRSIVSQRLKPGDPFPSVRTLSQELKINPNTAHKIIATLVDEKLLEVRPGIGTVVTEAPASTDEQRGELLNREVERLVVEAQKLGLSLSEVQESIQKQWHRLKKD